MNDLQRLDVVKANVWAAQEGPRSSEQWENSCRWKVKKAKSSNSLISTEYKEERPSTMQVNVGY